MSNIEKLAGAMYDAKRKEDAAKKERIALEEQIAALVETGDNASKTVDAADGLKVTVKRALGYKADLDAIAEFAKSRNLDVAPLKLVPEALAFDQKVYEDLRKNNPALFAEFSKHVVVTPRKVSVTLKLA